MQMNCAINADLKETKSKPICIMKPGKRRQTPERVRVIAELFRSNNVAKRFIEAEEGILNLFG